MPGTRSGDGFEDVHTSYDIVDDENLRIDSQDEISANEMDEFALP